MLPFGMANKLLKQLYDITGAEIALIAASMDQITQFYILTEEQRRLAEDFYKSGKSEAESEEMYMYRFCDDDAPALILAVYGEAAQTAGRIAAGELKVISEETRVRMDRGRLIKDALLGYSTVPETRERVRRLKIKDKIPRRVYLASVPQDELENAEEVIKAFIISSGNSGLVTSIGSSYIAVAKERENDGTAEDPDETAVLLMTLLTEEAVIDARIAYGGEVQSFSEIHKAYSEAKTAMDVGEIFYPEERVISYGNLGIGRLIYQMPEELCKIFLEETFDHDVFADMDDETLHTVQDFFDNNLNVSETARGMYIHRNTLVYRLDKLEKQTGLDIRKFDDAMTFKLAMMIELYLDYRKRNRLPG